MQEETRYRVIGVRAGGVQVTLCEHLKLDLASKIVHLVKICSGFRSLHVEPERPVMHSAAKTSLSGARQLFP